MKLNNALGNTHYKIWSPEKQPCSSWFGLLSVWAIERHTNVPEVLLEMNGIPGPWVMRYAGNVKIYKNANQLQLLCDPMPFPLWEAGYNNQLLSLSTKSSLSVQFLLNFLPNTYKKIISNNLWGKRQRLLPLSIKNEGHKDLRIYDLTPYDRSPLMKTPAISPFPFHLGNWICEFVAQFWRDTIVDGWRIAFVGNSNVPLMCSEFHFYLLSAL